MPSVGRCPSLGIDDDKDTCMTFATEVHHCYRLAQDRPVPLNHQNQYCLNENHIRCPIFLRGNRLFPTVAGTQGTSKQPYRAPSRKPLPRTVYWGIAGFAVVFILVIAGWWLASQTDFFTRPDPPVQAFSDLPPGVSPTATRITSTFQPKLTLLYDLTAEPTDEVVEGFMESIPVTGEQESTVTPSPSNTTAGCVLPDGWVTYTVKQWDTLYALSLAINSSVAELMEVNCLNSEDLIVGQEIFLPDFPPEPTLTSSSTSTSTFTNRPPTRTHTVALVSTNTPTRTGTLTSTVTLTATLTIPLPTETFTEIPPIPTETDIPPTTTDTEAIPEPTNTVQG